ncbi:unnamed protein product [Calypogeia fissa]
MFMAGNLKARRLLHEDKLSELTVQESNINIHVENNPTAGTSDSRNSPKSGPFDNSFHSAGIKVIGGEVHTATHHGEHWVDIGDRNDREEVGEGVKQMEGMIQEKWGEKEWGVEDKVKGLQKEQGYKRLGMEK